MFGSRRHARYPVNLRLRLQLPDGELETTTEDVSHAGFSAPCPRLPEEGSSFGFTVTLPDGREVKGTGSAMRVSGELAGFSCEFAADAQAAWDAFLAQEQGSGGVWRMLSRYARSESDTGRAIVEKGRFEALFQREQASAVRLHMVGENGEAYRVAFEKDPGSPLEESPFELVKRAASRMLSRDVFLRRSPGGAIEALRVVELKRGGFAYVVQQANGKASLMGLHGSELMVIEVDGSAVFPHFTVEELERIAADTFRREVEPATPTSSPSSFTMASRASTRTPWSARAPQPPPSRRCAPRWPPVSGCRSAPTARARCGCSPTCGCRRTPPRPATPSRCVGSPSKMGRRCVCSRSRGPARRAWCGSTTATTWPSSAKRDAQSR